MSKNKKKQNNIIQEEQNNIIQEEQNQFNDKLVQILSIIFLVFLVMYIISTCILIKTTNSLETAITNMALLHSNTDNQYNDFVYSLFEVNDTSDSFVDENNNIFYLNPECNAGDEIINPKFISRNSFRIDNSVGDRISVYLLKDGRLVYIPAYKNVKLSW